MDAADIKKCEPGAARQWVRIVRNAAAPGLRDVCGEGPAGARAAIRGPARPSPCRRRRRCGPGYRNRPIHERTHRRHRRGVWTVHRGYVAPHGKSQGADDQAAAQERGPVDGEPVFGPRLGNPRGRHHPEHVRDDIHRDEPSAIRADHAPGVARPDPRRVPRPDRPGRDRHLRHQGGFALRARARRRCGGERTLVEFQARGGVVPRRRHAHSRTRPSQGRRGTACRTALVPGTCWKAPGNRSRLPLRSPHS